MKKILLFIISIFTVGATLAQTVDDFSFEPQITNNNMSVVFPAGSLSNFFGGQLMAYNSDGDPVSSPFPIAEDGAGGIAVIGTDNLCNCTYLSASEEMLFAILMNGQEIVLIDVYPPLTYVANTFVVVNESLTFLNQDGSCYSDVDNDGICDENEIPGCQGPWADNFDALATDDDGSCYKNGCTDSEANNYDEVSTQDDGSCVYFVPITFQLSSGWNMVGYTGTADNNGIVAQMDAALGNGAGTANTFQVIKNVSGQFWSAAYAQISTFNQGQGYMMYVNGATTTVNFQQTSGYISGIEYALSAGWNMVAFTGDVDADNNIVSAMDAALVNGAGTANTFEIIKNVSGQFWSAAYAQINTFNPGQAYMMYVNGSPTTVNFQQ
jgi:hypothetical protein